MPQENTNIGFKAVDKSHAMRRRKAKTPDMSTNRAGTIAQIEC